MSSTKRVAVILGILLGSGIAYWLVSPLFITTRVSESLEDLPGQKDVTGAASSSDPAVKPMSAPVTLRSGTFIGQKAHAGAGTATLLEVDGRHFVRFENDFQVTNGPDLFVYLGKGGSYDAKAKLGSLKGSAGSQNYEIPATIDVAAYDEVWVWCRAFSVPFARAVLHR